MTLNGVTQQATIGATGSFSTAFSTAGLGVAGSPYTVTYAYSGDSNLGPAGSTSKLTITPATPTLSVADAGGTYDGLPFGATATVAGINGQASSSLEGAIPSLSYYVGTTATGTPLGGPPIDAGTYTVQASFPGSTDYTARSSPRHLQHHRGDPDDHLERAQPRSTTGRP